jgi:hypothetical protein
VRQVQPGRRLSFPPAPVVFNPLPPPGQTRRGSLQLMVSTAPETSAQSGKNDRARNVLLLPSHLFFVRSIDLPAGISPEELPSFVELSLEEISPFAINQLYYGYYLPAESSRVLVFAAYRKQLSVYEEDPAWISADLVLPDFTAALGTARDGPTLAFLQDNHALTALYWAGDAAVPDRVLSRHLTPVDGELQVEKVREELERKIGPLRDDVSTVSLTRPEAGIRDRNLVFKLREEGPAGGVSAEIGRTVSLPMDVRDKAFLQTTRRAQRQNRWLWAGVLTVCAGFLALAVFETALFAGRYILNTREANILALEPEVRRIQQEEELANRLAELSGERLLPFEMLAFLNQYRPPSIYYTRAVSNGLRSFEIDARTPRSQDVDRFQRLLENERFLENVEIRNLRLRAQDGLSSFTLAGTFRPGALSSFASREAAAQDHPADAEADEEEPPEQLEEITIPEIPDGELPDGDIVWPDREPAPDAGAPVATDLPEAPVEVEEPTAAGESSPLPPPSPVDEEGPTAAANEEEEL